MRPRRTLVAKLFKNGSLAPLVGLSALIAMAAAGSGSHNQSAAQPHPLVRLIHSVFQLVSPSAEKPSARSYPPGPPPRLLFAAVSASRRIAAAPPVPVTSPAFRRLQLRC
jgi:hypothetical protein